MADSVCTTPYAQLSMPMIYSNYAAQIDRAMTDSDTFSIMAESVWSKLSIMADFV